MHCLSRTICIVSKYSHRSPSVCLYYLHSSNCLSTLSQSPRDREDVNEKIRHSSLLKVEPTKDPKSLTPIEKVVRTGKDATYSGVIIIAFAVTGILIWAFFSEFFSGNSINSLFSRTLKVVRADEDVKRALGEPIRGFGEHTGWNRRRHIDHVRYKVGDDQHMRMEYNVRGQKRLGRVTGDLKKDSRGRFQIRYLLVQLEGRPAGTLIVQDTR